MRLTAKLVHVAAFVAVASGCGGFTAATASHDDGGTTEDASIGDVGSGGQDAWAMDGEAGGCQGTRPNCYGNDKTLCCVGWSGPASCVDGAWMCGSSPAPGCDGTACSTDGGTDGGGDGGRDGGCTPTTCAALGYTCGFADNGCGAMLYCGGCISPQYCGGGGFNQCGTGPDGGCSLTTCQKLGFDCGLTNDGCGNVLDCNTTDAGDGCIPPAYCGGGGFNKCGNPLLPPWCGAPGQPCCPGESCDGGGCCVGEQCVAAGQPCGQEFTSTCKAGSCGSCGGLGQPCCDVSLWSWCPRTGDHQGPSCTGCTQSGTMCSSTGTGGTCVACGADGMQCCWEGCLGANSYCDDYLDDAGRPEVNDAGLIENVCSSQCGGPGQPCCQGNTCKNDGCCLGGGCVASPTCGCTAGQCTTCGLTGQACCAGNTCQAGQQPCCTRPGFGMVGDAGICELCI
jgi:hypothetical protein